MKQIEETSRVIPVIAETDVLVVGSGPGGLSAGLKSGPFDRKRNFAVLNLLFLIVGAVLTAIARVNRG